MWAQNDGFDPESDAVGDVGYADHCLFSSIISDGCVSTIALIVGEVLAVSDLPALTGSGSELVYAASWFMGNSVPGTMISGAGQLSLGSRGAKSHANGYSMRV